MAVSESARQRLFRSLEHVLGEDEAATLMDSLPPHDWSDVATKTELRAGLAEVRGEIAELRAEMREGFAEMRVTMANLVTRAELRDEISLHVDARMGSIARNLFFAIGAMNATMITAVIAAIRLG